MNKIILLLSIVLLVVTSGCKINITSRGETEFPTGSQELKEFIARNEGELEGLEIELAEAKESRDALIEVAKTASFLSSYNRQISSANTDIEFIASRITWTKEDLAIAKERLKSSEVEILVE